MFDVDLLGYTWFDLNQYRKNRPIFIHKIEESVSWNTQSSFKIYLDLILKHFCHFFLIIKMESKTALKNFINQFSQSEVDLALENGNTLYNLRQYHIMDIDATSAGQIFEAIQKKFYRTDHLKSEMKWLQNQLRIFVWCLCCYIHYKKIKIQDLNSGDWEIFKSFFIYKSQALFEYQAKLIIQYSSKPSIWTKQEDELLSQVVLGSPKNLKWNQISKELFLLSEKKIIRNPKQCRQRWNNHIDPNKIKGSWKVSQCLKMYQFVKENGKKWAKLVKLFNKARDEHSIKNKFNSLFRKQKKTTPLLNEHQIYDLILARLRRTLEFYSSESMENFEDRGKEEDSDDRDFNFSDVIRKKLLGFNFSSNKSITTQYGNQAKKNCGQRAICEDNKIPLFIHKITQYPVAVEADNHENSLELFPELSSGENLFENFGDAQQNLL